MNKLLVISLVLLSACGPNEEIGKIWDGATCSGLEQCPKRCDVPVANGKVFKGCDE